MKKIIIIASLLLFCISITKAQIKVVGDDYNSTLTASKKYYEQDIEFEKIFPKSFLGLDYAIKPKNSVYYDRKTYNTIEKTIPRNLNCLGDTLWNYSTDEDCDRFVDFSARLTVCGCGFGIKTKGFKEELIFGTGAPVGYYVVSGYVIGRENMTELISSYLIDTTAFFYSKDYGGRLIRSGIGRMPSIKKLKEEVLVSNLYYLPNEYIAFVKLSSIDTTQEHIDYYAPCLSNFFNVKFFSVIKDKFLNQEVLLLNDDAIEVKQNDSIIYTIGGGPLVLEKEVIITDALSKDKIKIQDNSFVIRDVIVKMEKNEPYLYVILEGEKTGSFAAKPSSVQYFFDVSYESNGKTLFFEKNHSFDYNIPCLVYDRNYYILKKQDLNTIKESIVDVGTEIINKKQKEKQQEEKEILAKQNRIEQENKKRQEELTQRLIAKYGYETGTLISDKKIAIGMTQDMCRDAWGRPINTYRTTTKYGQSEVWCYNYKTRIYFFEGKVVQIDE